MLSNGLITYRQEGGAAFISFTGTPIEIEAYQALQYAFSDHGFRIASTPDIRVCIIDGISGETFTRLIDNKEGLDFWEKCAADATSLVRTVNTLDVPVIIAMNGSITGPGFELALACDLRLATPNSQFGCPHIHMGKIPFEGGTQRLSRLIGRGKALELILTGSLMDAQTAWQTGLIHYLVDENELDQTVEKMARKMAEKSPISLRYAKEAVKSGMDMTLEQGVRLEADLYFLMHTTDDRAEGISAFKEKRKPAFKGK